MAPRSKILRLPPKLRAELDRRLIESGFSGYAALARWLGEQGCPITGSKVHRYGRKLERRLETLRLATEQARAVVKAAGGADDTVNEGLMRLVQGDLFNVLLEIREIDPKKADLNALARNVASICRSAVQMRRLAEEMRCGIGKRVKAAERKVVEAARRGAAGGLSAQAERKIRAALLEIAELPAPPLDEPIPRARHLMDEGAGGSAATGEAVNGADTDGMRVRDANENE
jgi:hypothetical protein